VKIPQELQAEHNLLAGTWAVPRTGYTKHVGMRDRLVFDKETARCPELLVEIILATQFAYWVVLEYQSAAVGSSCSNKDLADWELSIPPVAARDRHCPEAVSGEGEEILT
jgi:hypothetical protein